MLKFPVSLRLLTVKTLKTEVNIFNVIDVKISNSDIDAAIDLASRKTCNCSIYNSETLFIWFAQ